MVPTACRHEFIALLPRSSLRSLLEEFANFALTRELVKIFVWPLIWPVIGQTTKIPPSKLVVSIVDMKSLYSTALIQ